MTSNSSAPTPSEATEQNKEQTSSERVAYARVRDITLPHRAGTMALLTLDNGLDHTKPTTLGPRGLAGLDEALRLLGDRVDRGEITAVGVTGKPFFFCAGADLTAVGHLADRDAALALGQAGHNAFRRLNDVGVPTFAFVNGLALGGGLELALNCDYRSVSNDAAGLGLPETSLGLIPGWGGTFWTPRLTGLTAALDVIITRPAQNKPFNPGEAYEIGLVDALFEAPDFLEQSIEWAADILRGEIVISRAEVEPQAAREVILAEARKRVDAAVHGSRPAPYRALDLLALDPHMDRDAHFAAEDEALADLLMTDELRASLYAFNTVNRGKRPTGAPSADLAQPVTTVGIVGAGLMAAQLALLFAQRLGVSVIMRDLDNERVEKGLGFVQSTVSRLTDSGRISQDTGARIGASVRGTTDLTDLAHCDFVIEAVTEVLELKQKVFAELETIVAPTTILATNTSALSITAMAEGLANPERVVGLHFFNPVAQMPLVEIVSAAHTSPEALATAFAVAKKLRKTAVKVSDRPGFVVNRLLVLLLGEIMRAVDAGTPVEVADRALRPLGLPMGPFALFDLVGPAVGLHVLQSLRAGLGDRFAHSPGLERIVAEQIPVVRKPAQRGAPVLVDPELEKVLPRPHSVTPADEDAVLDAVLHALTVEIGLMLEEGVVESPTQIDLAMILGAGWPFASGGICPYLDRTGYSERVLGRRLLPEGVANVPA